MIIKNLELVSDLQLYHSGSHSFIDRKSGGTGDIFVRLGGDNDIELGMLDSDVVN